jgi:hypothetical protein
MQHQNDCSQHSRAKRHGPYQPATPSRALTAANTGQDSHFQPGSWLFTSTLLQRCLEQFIHEMISLVIAHV